MIGFNDEEAKHAFFTELNTDRQIAFIEFYKALMYLGFDMHVLTVVRNGKARLEIVVRVHEQT